VIQPRLLDVNEIVISLTKMLQRVLGEDLHLQLNLHPRALMTRADAGMLDHVLLNLVVNARDAMTAGGRLVIETSEVTLTQHDVASMHDASAGRHVVLRVKDTGAGIAPEHLPHIFEPFFTTKEAGKGTGLGLATVFGIVKQHRGWIAVRSDPGRGTTFEVFLRAEDVSSHPDVEGAGTARLRPGSETILLVEDEPGVRMLARAVLERHGYNVLEAPNGVTALQVWEQHHDSIRLLLTDMVMPHGLSGRELASRLRSRNPALPVVFTSGYSPDIAGRELSLREGQNFLQKPFSPQQLLEIVGRGLDQQRL
jgi:two-component system cell cycle sensor histidine kinase/response regulator CckA